MYECVEMRKHWEIENLEIRERAYREEEKFVSQNHNPMACAFPVFPFTCEYHT